MSITRKLPVAKVGEIPSGRTKAFRFGHANGIAFNDDGTVKAYVNGCTHMGGPVDLVAGKGVLRCRWHAAEFNPRTGDAIEGEAPKGTRLKPIELVVEGDQIFGVLELSDDFA
jgi:nitrite reductase/ring-hydroxylating ferredoxin subunit